LFRESSGPLANLYNRVDQAIHAADCDLSGIVNHIREVIDSQAIEMNSLKTVRTRSVLKRTLDWINSHRDPTLPIRTLCRDTGISERTLERYFNITYDCTPKQYLIKIRLNRVRMRLKSADPYGSSVSKIASSEGFKHMGRFAFQYMSLFEETPKKTLGYRL
jgi:transcriptional regulator GlxA family with amidase domain